MAMEDKFDVKLNQNIWGLVIGFAALGASEHWHLTYLFWLSLLASVGAMVSVAVTMVAYTRYYWKRKCTQANRIGKLRFGSANK